MNLRRSYDELRKNLARTQENLKKFENRAPDLWPRREISNSTLAKLSTWLAWLSRGEKRRAMSTRRRSSAADASPGGGRLSVRHRDLIVIVASSTATRYHRPPRYTALATHHLEQPTGQRDISPVSVNFPSASKNISVPGLIPWHYHWSPVNYSPPPVDPEVILLLGPL